VKVWLDDDGKKFNVESAKRRVELMNQVPGAKFRGKLLHWQVPLTYPTWIAFYGIMTGARVLVEIDPEMRAWVMNQYE